MLEVDSGRPNPHLLHRLTPPYLSGAALGEPHYDDTLMTCQGRARICTTQGVITWKT